MVKMTYVISLNNQKSSCNSVLLLLTNCVVSYILKKEEVIQFRTITQHLFKTLTTMRTMTPPLLAATVTPRTGKIIKNIIRNHVGKFKFTHMKTSKELK